MHPWECWSEWLAQTWETEARLYQKRGLHQASDMAESYANELKNSVTRWLDEPLTLREAADFSGYAYSTLEHRVRLGELPNAGEKGSPRVKRRDLPLKVDSEGTERLVALSDVDDPDDLDDLLTIAEG